MTTPCSPDNAAARKILESCANHFAATKDDCNKFLKAALGDFLPDHYLDGLNADGIVNKIKDANEGWTPTRDIATAIAKAKTGHIVVAGMTSTSLGHAHGHVAVVVGCDGAMSGSVTVPLGYAGALESPAARLEGGRLSGTFAATLVRSQQLDYYWRTPDQMPA